MANTQSGEMVASTSSAMRSLSGADTPRSWLRAVTDEDWTVHQPLITRLYLDESKALKDVMNILESEHGFKASENMYKKRIAKWGLDKRIKDHESRAIIRIQLQRAAHGKASLFQRRGRVIDLDAVLRSVKRKRLRTDVIEAGEIMLPAGITCTTPQATVFPRPSATWNLDCHQRLFTLLETYVTGAFSAHIWLPESNKEECTSTRCNGQGVDILTRFYDACNTGCLLFARRTVADNEKGRRLLATGFGLVPQILQTEHPRTLEYLLDIIIYILQKWQCAEVAPLMLRHFSEMADVYLPPKHPLGQMFLELLRNEQRSLLHAAVTSYRILADLFERLLGPFHVSTMQCRRLLIHRVDTNIDAQVAEERIRGLLASCEQEYGPRDDRCVDLRYTLAQNLRQQKRCVDVEREAMKLIRQALWITSSSRKRADRLCDGYDILSRAQLQQHKVGAARENLTRAVEVSAAEHGPDDTVTLYYRQRLESWRASHDPKQVISGRSTSRVGVQVKDTNELRETGAILSGSLDVHLKDRPCDCDELVLDI